MTLANVFLKTLLLEINKLGNHKGCTAFPYLTNWYVEWLVRTPGQLNPSTFNY